MIAVAKPYDPDRQQEQLYGPNLAVIGLTREGSGPIPIHNRGGTRVMIDARFLLSP